ncbi:MAG: hypothetical protein SF182_07210, partial [Deltaproteobacteria bacterium]|nr:hypothetical protein [Deltaproteobacteria bacterium]
TSGDFGTLNGGSTDQPLIGSFTLADEYALGDIAASTVNTLQWFDNCGYGYAYEESGDTDPTLGTRKQLPTPPDSRTAYQYAITNHLSGAIVLGKECCASWYQENSSVTPTAWEPPVQIDNSYGAFIAAGQSLSYETLFSDEALVIYDAGTGSQLFKLRLNASDPAVYACSADEWSVGVGSTAPYAVSIGAAGENAHGCGDVGLCPFGTTLSQTDSTVTCTVTESSFILGVEEWAAALATVADVVQVSAWGASGEANTGSGGAGGFALTVLTPDDFDQSLYAYIGDDGASSVLIAQPLSLVTSAVAEDITDPSSIGVLLIAGGGGSSGAGLDTGGNGGGGATASANTTPSGNAVSVAGSSGQSDGADGGTGGNSTGAGDGGSLGGNAGVGGYSSSVGWNDSGSLIPPQSWDAGSGPGGSSDCDVTGGKGGGGFGSGGYGHANCSGSGGGGGGGSWAAANTAYDASAPTSAPESPGNDSGDDGALTISYALPAACTASASSVSCLLSSNASAVDLQGIATLASFTAALAGQSVSIGTDTPLWIRAWGGQGGANDGTLAGGAQGMAQTVTTLASLQSTYGSTTLYYYVGSLGDGSHEAGKGGSSTIVSSADLSSTSACLPPTTSGCTQNILLIAGGGGGAGSGDDGGPGGQAFAGYNASATQPGGDSDDAGGGSAGVGGSANGTGDGGSAGSDGIGGMGGPVHTSNGASSSTGWLNATPATIGANGEGGEGKHDSSSDYIGGGGGGGWGGGGGGGAGGSEGHGGGGGGSYAVGATENVAVPSGAPGTTNGAVEIGFILSGD